MNTEKVQFKKASDRYDINKIKRDATKTNRTTEKGIINDKAKSSVMLHDNGTVTVASSKYASYSLSKEGRISSVSLEDNTITNRKTIHADEVIINKHKLNPSIYELSDPREVLNDKNSVVGGLNMSGTVLVKAWDKQLKKYVLIRRPYRAPIFSPTISPNEIPTQMR